jgi:hypothetical protein
MVARESKPIKTAERVELPATTSHESATPTPPSETRIPVRESRPATPLANSSLPRYTMESVDEPRLHYRRRKRKRGELLRQVMSNVQMMVIFFAALIGMLLLIGRC